MEGMMPRMLCTGVFICTIIALQIEFTLAFAWKNVSRNIFSCEHDDVQLTWDYDLNPGEYVKAKTWFTGENKTAKRIAYWKDTDGLKIEPAYTDRVLLAGSGQDSLILKRVTASDEGMYTLIPSFPLSSEPDPRLALKLSIYVSPLKQQGCCKPEINATNDELHAFLDSEQGCGKPAPIMNWNISRNKMVRNSTLILGDNDRGGTYKVCLTGPAVVTCFKGDKETLCAKYTVTRELEVSKFPQTTEQNTPLVAGLSVGGTIIVLTVILVIIIKINWRRIQTYRQINKRWKTAGGTLNFEDDNTLLQSLIPTEEAMKEIANCMYIFFKHSRDLALEEINTTHVALENSEIIYIDNDTDSVDGADLIENRETNPSYAHSFYHKDKLLKLLVVQGELGMGKTTWCRKLVSTWCKAHECQYHQTPVQANDDNIQTMKSFPLLFFVSLRNAHKGLTLMNIIQQQCSKGNGIQNEDSFVNLDLLIKNRHNKLIFIIHGVDEAEENVDILKEIVSQTMNCLTILTCRDWKAMRSKCRIEEKDYRPMAYLTLKHVNIDNVALYANSIFEAYGYPNGAVKEFMEMVGMNKLETFMKETYFVQPLINIWRKSGMLPSNATDVCLCLIDDILKEKTKLPRSNATFNLVSEVDRVPKVRGKIFVISYGKVLCLLGKIALTCLQNESIKDIFHEKEMEQLTNTTAKELTEICIAAKLVSTAPVSDSSTVNKRLCFQNKIMQCFLVAFHLACKGESQVKDIQSEECETIQTFLTSLSSIS